MIRAIEANDLPDLDKFPASHRTAYAFYLGRYSFLQEQYVKAEKNLGIALRSCHDKSTKNRRMILHYLIPCRMICLGQMPKENLLQRNGIESVYSPLIMAIRSGNLCGFESALKNASSILLRFGTYIAFERMQQFVWRSLILRSFQFLQINNSTNNNRMPLSWIITPNVSGSTDCFVANLIASGFIKAYIAGEKGIIVFSPKEPFPAVAEVIRRTMSLV